MSEPTCECGHSRFDHELPEYTERPGPCTEWDCECPWYDGPDQDDLDAIDEFKAQLQAIGAANTTTRPGDRSVKRESRIKTAVPFPSGVSLAASQRWDAARSGSGPARRGAVLAAGLGVGVRLAGRVVLTGVGWLTGCVRSCRLGLSSSVTRSNRLDRFPRSTTPVRQTVPPAADAPPVPAMTSPRSVPPVRAGRSRAFRTVRTDSPGPGFGGGSGGDAA